MNRSFVLVCALFAVLAAIAPAEARDLVRIGGSAVVEKGEQVQDAVAVGGDVTVHGEVRGDAVAIGGDVIVKAGGQVGNDAVAVGGRLVMEPGAEIGGSEIEVAGEAMSEALEWASVVPVVWGPLKAFYWMGKLVALLALGMLLLTLLPAQMEAVMTAAERNAWKTVAVGLVGVLAIAPFLALLCLTIIGIPLIPLVITAVAVALLFGYVGVGYLVGRKLPWEALKGRSPLLALALGMLLLSVANEVPWLGWLVFFAASLLGFGAVLRSTFGRLRKTATPAPLPE
jgi:hypothetical protein